MNDLFCADSDFRENARTAASGIRGLGSMSSELADVLDDDPSAIQLPETLDIADSVYSAADPLFTLASVFPDERLSEALIEYASWLGAAGYFLQYGYTDADAAEAAEALRNVAEAAPGLANSLEGLC